MGEAAEIVAPELVSETEPEDLLLVVEIIERAVVGHAVDDGVGVEEVKDLACLSAVTVQCEYVAVGIDKAEALLVPAGSDNRVGCCARQMTWQPPHGMVCDQPHEVVCH